jgi:hypothetical protein
MSPLYNSLKPMASGPRQVTCGHGASAKTLSRNAISPRSSATSSIVGQLAAQPARLLTFMTMRSSWVPMLSRRSKLPSLRCMSTTPTIYRHVVFVEGAIDETLH